MTLDGSQITRDGLDWGDVADPFRDVLQYTLPVVGQVSLAYEVVDGVVIGTRHLIEMATVVWDHERASDLAGDVRDTVVSVRDRAADLAGDAVDLLTRDIDLTPWN